MKASFLLLLVALAVVDAGRMVGIRPVTYKTEADGCVGGSSTAAHTYTLSSGTANWYDAEADCSSLGGHLASIHDDATEQAIQEIVMGQDAWIGLYDPSVDETGFEWTDGSCPTYESWAPGEPNELGDEDCVHIAWSWSLGGGWNDQNCFSTFKYVCQIEVSSVLTCDTGFVLIDGACQVLSTIRQTEVLLEGEWISSPSQAYQLIMQNDGNLVLYQGTAALWSSGTSSTGSSPYSATLQADGNFVVYAEGVATWASGTLGAGGEVIVLQDDGNLVLYDASGGAVWNTGTYAELLKAGKLPYDLSYKFTGVVDLGAHTNKKISFEQQNAHKAH